MLAIVLAAAGSWSSAQAQMRLIVHGKDGSTTEAQLKEVRSLAFKQGGFDMLFQKSGQAANSFQFANVKSIEFASVITGLDQVVKEENALGLDLNGNSLKVTGWNGKAAPAAIYGVSGQCFYNNPLWNGEVLNIASLPAGVYVLKVNNATFKFRK